MVSYIEEMPDLDEDIFEILDLWEYTNKNLIDFFNEALTKILIEYFMESLK